MDRHNKVKPFECEKCGCKFTSKSDLKKHNRSHGGKCAGKCSGNFKAFTPANLQSVTDQHVHGKQGDAKNTQSQQPGTSDEQFHPNTQSDTQLLDHDDPSSEAEEVELRENPIASVSHVNTHSKRKMTDFTI